MRFKMKNNARESELLDNLLPCFSACSENARDCGIKSTLIKSKFRAPYKQKKTIKIITAASLASVDAHQSDSDLKQSFFLAVLSLETV